MTAAGAPPAGQTPSVRRLGRDGDVGTIADVLAGALADSPLRQLVPGRHHERRTALRRGLLVVAGWATAHGAVYLRDDGAGAAIWLPTGPHRPPAPDPLGVGPAAGWPGSADEALDAALVEVGADAPIGHGLETLTQVLLPSRVSERATLPAYLLVVGVEPDARRDGVARQLLAAHHPSFDAGYVTGHAVAVDVAGHQLLTSEGYRPRRLEQAGPSLSVQWMYRPPQPVQDGAA